MKTNGVPAVVMLSAGLIDCVIAIRSHLSLFEFTKQLLLVLLLFYFIGCVVKIILDRNFADMNEEKEEQEETQGDEVSGEDGTDSEPDAGAEGQPGQENEKKDASSDT